MLSWAQASGKARAWFEIANQEAVLVAGGEVLPSGPYTVAQALHDYFEDGRRRGVKGLNRDESRAGAWIIPELGPVAVASLTRNRLESWLAKVAEAPRLCGPRNQAPQRPGAEAQEFQGAQETQGRARPPCPARHGR